MSTPSYSGTFRTSLVWALFFSSALSVTGCASTQAVTSGDDIAATTVSPVDPYENFNRSVYGFNMGVDKYLLKPIADGYRFVTPNFLQTGVTNFFNNLKGINVVLNDLLQGKFEQSAADTGRFLTNSTIGVLGLFDVATDMGLEANIEDFGQTLAVWGVDQGPYLVLPLLGPTTLRDGGAIIVDRAANPSTYLPGTGIIEGINERANAEGAINFIDEAALDPYIFTRESFLQYRKNLINDGKTDIDSLDFDIDDALDDGATTDAEKTVNEVGESQEGQVTTQAAPSTVDAFSNMSKSIDDALMEFEEASLKLDEMSKNEKLRAY